MSSDKKTSECNGTLTERLVLAEVGEVDICGPTIKQPCGSVKCPYAGPILHLFIEDVSDFLPGQLRRKMMYVCSYHAEGE